MADKAMGVVYYQITFKHLLSAILKLGLIFEFHYTAAGWNNILSTNSGVHVLGNEIKFKILFYITDENNNCFIKSFSKL